MTETNGEMLPLGVDVTWAPDTNEEDRAAASQYIADLAKHVNGTELPACIERVTLIRA